MRVQLGTASHIRMRLLLVVAVILLLGAVAAGCGGEDAEDTDTTETEPTETNGDDETTPDDEQEGAEQGEAVNLTYAFFAPEGTFPGRQMQEWVSQVEERTDGQVTVETFPGGTLLGAEDMYDGVLQGVADIGLGAPSYDPGRFPLTAGVSQPVGFPNSRVASLTFWDLYNEFQPAAYDDFKVLTVFTTEPGHLMTEQPVRAMEDLEGMKLRTAGSGIPVLEALGAAPVGMPMPEVPEAIQTGLIEGLMTSREVLEDFKLAESLGYTTDYPTVVVTFAAVMDRNRWEELPEDVQQVFDELGREMALWTGEYHDIENVQGALEWSQENHGLEIIELSDEETARWDEALAPLVDGWIEEQEAQGLPAQDFIDRLEEIRDEYAEEYSS